MICRTEALVLRTHRMTESSLVAVLFSREWGKLRLSAKGARRPKSRFGACLQPLTKGHFVYYRKEGRELQTLSEGDIIDPYEGLKKDYERLAYGSALCELLDHLTIEDDANRLLFSIAVDSLSFLERVDRARLALPYLYFQIKAAGALGYRPHLSGCVVTGTPLSGARAWFSPDLGGTSLREAEGPGVFLSMDTVRFLDRLQTGNANRMDEAVIDNVDVVEARRALRLFLSHHVVGNRRPKATAFLDRLIDACRLQPGGAPARPGTSDTPASEGQALPAASGGEGR